ncbi:RCC1 domain-containing protein [Paenibacillus roseus]|uniref:RCC1 domain-containing protein n=1 Tax=Paenibacillus roseus TaxID=2798579 RepID=UPI002FCE526A
MLSFFMLFSLTNASVFANSNGTAEKKQSIQSVKELVDQRTRYSKTFLNKDGSTRVDSSEESINYFDGRVWREIDTTIRKSEPNSEYSHHMLTNNFNVKLNNKNNKQKIQFSLENRSVTYHALGMNNVDGVVKGNKLTFSQAWRSTDMEYEIQNDELKMELHLADKKAPKKFSFEFTTENVEHRINPDGSIDFFEPNGRISFQIPRMWVIDASSDEKRYDKLDVIVTKRGSQTVLELTLDNKGLQYPIVIDPTTSLAVDAGGGHSLELKSDGTVWAWGANGDGQLGDGTTTQRTTPVQVSGLTNVIAVAGGSNHSLAVKQDGTVWAWGYNRYGQLGDGTTIQRTTPVQVSGLTNVISVVAGDHHSLAIKQDGTVWVWGYNSFGQLGDGTKSDRTTPVQVSGLNNVISVSAAREHSLALKQDGTIWTWGNNNRGQLGDGTRSERTTPVQVSGLTSVISVVAGAYHSLAIKQDGTIWAWGYNAMGQLGNGTGIDHSIIPMQVINLNNVRAVAAGGHHSLAIKQDGTVWAWGSNLNGELGDGTNTNRYTPVQVTGLSDVIAVEAGNAHSIAFQQDGTVWTWGLNFNGQLGDGTTAYRAAPVQVIGLTNTRAAAAGSTHSIAVKQDGTVWEWGERTDSYKIKQLTSLSNVEAVVARGGSSLAVKQDGTLWAWGDNSNGQLGNGTTAYRVTTPVQVSGLTNVMAAAAGDTYSLAVKQDGTVWAWGANNYGQLGDGTTIGRTTPVQVSGLTDVIAVAGGNSHSLAVKQDGTVWAWGNNGSGRLGDGTQSNRITPVQVSGLNNVVSVSAGSSYSLAVKQDGTVWAWGSNGAGQLGDGTFNNRATPVQVSGLNNVRIASGGGSHSVAVKNDGTVWVWGTNNYGELGFGTTTPAYRNTAVQVSGLVNIISVSAGSSYSLAVKQDGTVWAWGNNSYGQLGDETRFTVKRVGAIGAPTELKINRQWGTNVDLTWLAPGGEIISYDIYNGNTLIGTVPGNITSYTFSNLIANTTYTFTIKARNAYGASAASNAVTVTLRMAGKIRYNYDQAGRLISLTNKDTGEIIQTYDYDANGNLIKTISQ